MEGRTVNADPLMPATGRLPMNPLSVPVAHDGPSDARPFVLRGVDPSAASVVVFKHRTDASKRKVEEKTNLDNKEVDDSYTVPDD